jgi:hypothetical protein
MAFPISPTDGQLYTTSLGTIYQYQAIQDRWLLYSHTIVGETGAQGFTGLPGPTGLLGPTGIIGFTGAQGFTGAPGFTGAQGVTGIVGLNVTSGTAAPPSPVGYPNNAIYIQYIA